MEAFVSVTYGAGGSTRKRTIHTTARIRQRTDLRTMAHLAHPEGISDSPRAVVEALRLGRAMSREPAAPT